MRARGIETTLGTYSMHVQPYFRERFGVLDADMPNATRAHHGCLTIPLYPGMTRDDVENVVGALGASIAAQGGG